MYNGKGVRVQTDDQRREHLLAMLFRTFRRPWFEHQLCMDYKSSFQVRLSLTRFTRVLTGFSSLSTLRREYAALAALPYYDSVDTILQARLPPPARVDRYEVEQTMKTYQVNEPQAKAIVASMNTEGFTLIQGYSSYHNLRCLWVH